MDKKTIKKLAELSFQKNKLNENRVQRISKLLPRKILKEYVKALKRERDKNRIIVETPDITKARRLNLEKMFKGKNIEYFENKRLIAGLKIINGDDVYELSVEDSLNSMKNYLSKI